MSNDKESLELPTTLIKPHYVGIGASAGGLEAIQAFFKTMPLDSGLTFIVIQHLSPDYKSMMDELLAKVTEIPVQVVEDGIEVRPNHIYLIPPRKNMSIFHRKLLLSAQDRTTMTVNLPIDLFFHSLAEDQGCNSVAIVLSGTGSDGTRGCRAIKEAGGLVMVQSEASAKFEGMPKSVITNGLADFIMDVEELPEQLLRYVNHPLANKSEVIEPVAAEKSALAKIFSMLRTKSKIDFTFYKPPTITRRIERRMNINQVSTLDEYVNFLTEHPAEQKALYRELLIGVTSFFRDTEVFELLEKKLLKNYIQKHEADELRIWVAGCSTGEEAYTYGMLCQELCEQLGKRIDIKIFATDIDQEALSKASLGVYSDVVTSDLPVSFSNKFFKHNGETYQINRDIREMVVFARHDLIKDPPFINIDLISCRNLLIYLQPILQRRIFDGFNFSLKPNGLLVLGSSESLGDAEQFFDTLDIRSKIFKSRGNRKPLLRNERFSTPDPLSMLVEPLHSNRHHDAKALEECRMLDSFLEAVADSYIPFAMIVNENHELLRVVGDSKNYIRPFSGKVSMDISKNLVKDLSVPVVTGLSKVFKTRTEVNFTNVRIQHGGVILKVNLSIKPLIVQRNHPLLATVLIHEVGCNPDTLPTAKKNAIKYDVDEEIYSRIGDLEQELQFTRENLQATIEELETSNEELQATNEELLASNEELQSTNEELQSVNEELYTVNAEYQNKISELSELNADLDNFMASSLLVAVFLDESMRLRKFTSNAKNLFNVIEYDVGRPFEHISYRLKTTQLIPWAEEVIKSGREKVAQVQSTDGDWYDLRIRPYMLSHEARSGVLIVLHEINALKESQDELELMVKRQQLAQTLTDSGSWDWCLADGTMRWSENVETMLGIEKGRLQHTLESFLDCVHYDDRAILKEKLDAALLFNTPYQVEHRIVASDNTIRWVEQRGATIQDEHGKATHMLGIIHEISRRKQRESQDIQALLKYKLILSAVSEAVYGLDTEGRIIFANAAACYFLGWSEQEMLGHYQHEFITHCLPDELDDAVNSCPAYAGSDNADCQKSACGIFQVLRESKQVQVCQEYALHRDGRYIAIEYTASPICEGDTQHGVVVVFRAVK
jgi:two-component system CheB/CheR fusion protein